MARFKVLANSLPRGGPFLLAGALDLLGYAKYAGGTPGLPRALNFEEVRKARQDESPATGSEAFEVSAFAPWNVAPGTLRRWLEAVPPGHYLMAHVGAAPALPGLLAEAGYRHLTILRDPRALLAALLFEDEVMPRFLRAAFAPLPPASRLEFMWRGGAVREAGVVLKPFAEIYRAMLAWNGTPGGLSVRFEDLAGEAGGGGARQSAALDRIAAHLGEPVIAERADRPDLDLVADPSTRFFQSGRRGEWTEVLGTNLMDRIQSLCAPLCREAGYEV